MEVNKLTPRMFGLKVRQHPDTLIVTARNKMRSASAFTQSISLASELIETHLLNIQPDALDSNRSEAKRLVENIEYYRVREQGWYLPKGQHLFRDVPYEIVKTFLERFRYHEHCMRVQRGPLLDYLDKGKRHELAKWDVGVTAGRSLNQFKFTSTFGANLRERVRGDVFEDGNYLSIGNKFRVGQATDEALGLRVPTYEEVKEAKSPRQPSGKDFRGRRSKPLLLIHPLEILSDKRTSGGETILEDVVAFGISFPDAQGRIVEPLEYMVNTVWWRNFMEPDQEDEELEETEE